MQADDANIDPPREEDGSWHRDSDLARCAHKSQSLQGNCNWWSHLLFWFFLSCPWTMLRGCCRATQPNCPGSWPCRWQCRSPPGSSGDSLSLGGGRWCSPSDSLWTSPARGLQSTGGSKRRLCSQLVYILQNAVNISVRQSVHALRRMTVLGQL